MLRLSVHSKLRGNIFLVMIFSTLVSVTFVNCFFVQYAYSGLDIRNLSNYFGREVEYTLTSSSENYFILHYVRSGGYAGNLKINNINISYDSRTNELSGNCLGDPIEKQLSDSDAKNLELMIDQNNELFATNPVYLGKGADIHNYNLTVIIDSEEHYSTWSKDNRDIIPASLAKIEQEIQRIAACKA